MSEAGGVAIVFRFRPVGDDKYLNVIIQSRARPKRIALIAVYLVEGFLQRHATLFQFTMHQGQTIDKDGHIIAILFGSSFWHILIEHLQMVVVNILLVNQFDVLRIAVVKRDVHNLRLLYALRLVLNGHLS